MTDQAPREQGLDRAGRLLAARLDEGLGTLGPDIGERLRFARERAVARARQSRLQAAPTPAWAWTPAGGAAVLAGAGTGAGGSSSWMMGVRRKRAG